MAGREGPGAEEKRQLERARLVVFGHLAPVILHETNNVLTVMAGVRQFMKSSAPLSDKIGTMIDEQLKRMDDLVGSIRRIGPDDATGGGARAGSSGLGEVVDALEPVVRLAGKGRGVTVERGELAAATPERREPLVLAVLAFLLPLLPPRGQGGATRVAIGGSGADGRAELRVNVSPSREPPEAEDVALVRGLLASSGGSLRFERSAAGFDVAFDVPARRA
ncbi:MAG TPA: hypothetical protein VFG37_09700 [Planctomycetota bacterium]|jgi:hypothetical protein|nr:hypothetical protein [Planctomycetota bacterium]